ncbi:E3 SUMO-protein ligase PIAS2-like isoform X3 [Gigantopelta aegis]|uniref:E3 SUMO-protein ligase PIAS2-like isoform X3 n=1 Tax=Gigantopelta aegis TaxID=1735272 RepID=UPI001B88B9C3|nr:E3 SUMO-protein ligase PIAS2-like isoform X3 [Gigantopelta aegis]
MADAADLKHMVMSFRVSELQVLLGFAGRNKSGRKQELLQRALQLVQKGTTMPVQIKIRELYRQIFNSANLNKRRTIYPGSTSPSQAIPDPQPQPPGIPVHPDVRFKHLPFYDVLGELMKPTSLVPKNNSRFQESYFVFHLTPQQAQDIAMSRDFRPGARCEYTVQVQLRFCLLETSCEQDDNFPPSICVRVNGKMAPLPNPLPTSKPGVEPKRPGRPVDITSLCRLSPTISNQLDVSWASEYARGYCLSVYLVRRLTSDILFHRLKQFGNRHPDHTKALIKEKLTQDPDSEIATTSLRVSLICPLGKMKLSIPCRPSTCTHLQCFDAQTFLMMNEKKPTWICPVCDKAAPFDKLMIDGYFVDILRNSISSDIQFHEDGSWSPLKQNKETHLISSPVVKPQHSSTSQSTDVSPPKKPHADVIDLTISDDDDDEPPRSSSRPSGLGCVSPGVINLDTPTPPHASCSRSISNSPATVVLSNPSSQTGSQSPMSSPQPSLSPVSPRVSFSPHPTTSATGLPPPPLPILAHVSVPPPLNMFPGIVSSALSTAPSTVSLTPNPLPPAPTSAQALANQSLATLNLDALSDREFEEFLQGLSW